MRFRSYIAVALITASFATEALTYRLNRDSGITGPEGFHLLEGEFELGFFISGQSPKDRRYRISDFDIESGSHGIELVSRSLSPLSTFPPPPLVGSLYQASYSQNGAMSFSDTIILGITETKLAPSRYGYFQKFLVPIDVLDFRANSALYNGKPLPSMVVLFYELVHRYSITEEEICSPGLLCGRWNNFIESESIVGAVRLSATAVPVPTLAVPSIISCVLLVSCLTMNFHNY